MESLLGLRIGDMYSHAYEERRQIVKNLDTRINLFERIFKTRLVYCILNMDAYYFDAVNKKPDLYISKFAPLANKYDIIVFIYNLKDTYLEALADYLQIKMGEEITAINYLNALL